MHREGREAMHRGPQESGRGERSSRRATLHSYRSASIGCSDAAFHAGYQPKPVPIMEQTTRPVRAQPHGKTTDISQTKTKMLPPPTPKMIPIRPPTSERRI